MGMTLPPFQRLVDDHWRDVARLAAALAGPGDAEDVAQQAWLQALRAYPSLRHGRNLKSWLLTITARAATDTHRARARRPAPVPRVPDHPAPRAEPSDDHLWKRVRALPERQRTAIALHYVLDLPHTEAARVLGTTPAMSRRLVSDALATLRGGVLEEAGR